MKLLKSLLVSSLALSISAFAQNANPLEMAKESAKQAVTTTQQSAKSAVADSVTNAKSAITEKTGTINNAKNSIVEKATSSVNSAKNAVGDKLNNAKESAASVKEKATAKVGQAGQTARDTLNSAKTNAENAQQAVKSVAKNGKININTADVATLQQLDGIGEVKAKAIVEYRQKHGAFKKASDLTKVTGIGDATVEGLKSSISFK